MAEIQGGKPLYLSLSSKFLLPSILRATRKERSLSTLPLSLHWQSYTAVYSLVYTVCVDEVIGCFKYFLMTVVPLSMRLLTAR